MEEGVGVRPMPQTAAPVFRGRNSNCGRRRHSFQNNNPRRGFATMRASCVNEHLRDALEMLIAGDQHEIVFQDQRRNPKIVVGNRRAGAFELHEQPRIVLGGFPRREQDSDRGLGQEASEKDFVAMLLRAAVESRLDLGQDHQREPDFVAFAQPVGQLRVALKQIGEPVGVERHSHSAPPHFHLSQSIWRWEAMISSNAGSGVHWPTRPEKSALRVCPMVARVSSLTTT